MTPELDIDNAVPLFLGLMGGMLVLFIVVYAALRRWGNG